VVYPYTGSRPREYNTIQYNTKFVKRHVAVASEGREMSTPFTLLMGMAHFIFAYMQRQGRMQQAEETTGGIHGNAI